MKTFDYTVPVTVKVHCLTEEECKQLTRWGYAPSEVKQCDDAVKVCRYTHIDANGKRHRMSCKKAREMLNEDQWLSGIARAAFHCDSMREINDSESDKEFVRFDCSGMFR